jgi:endonuclease/exonuclease/phosphatase family metal-dependent hydrolase
LKRRSGKVQGLTGGQMSLRTAARECEDASMPRHARTTTACAAVRRLTSVVLAACALSGALATGGCAAATNYLDPVGPVYRDSSHAALEFDHAIRVVTFNIQYARHIDRAIEALRSHPALRGADIVALQEMDAPGVEAIARALRMNYVYYPISVHPRAGRDFGNAVLSPWPIDDSRKLLLPHLSRVRKQARAAVEARIRIGGQSVQVYSLHLGSPLTTGGGDRRRQAAALLASVRSIREPVIVAGDLNSHGIGAQFESEGFAWPTKDVGATVHGFSFDHVFVRGLPLAGAVAGVARDVRDASDHRPVWADVRVDDAWQAGSSIRR